MMYQQIQQHSNSKALTAREHNDLATTLREKTYYPSDINIAKRNLAQIFSLFEVRESCTVPGELGLWSTKTINTKTGRLFAGVYSGLLRDPTSAACTDFTSFRHYTHYG